MTKHTNRGPADAPEDRWGSVGCAGMAAVAAGVAAWATDGGTSRVLAVLCGLLLLATAIGIVTASLAPTRTSSLVPERVPQPRPSGRALERAPRPLGVERIELGAVDGGAESVAATSTRLLVARRAPPSIEIRDASSNRVLGTCTGLESPARVVAARDGGPIAAVEKDATVVRLWDEMGHPLEPISRPAVVKSLALSADALVLGHADGTLAVVDLTTRTVRDEPSLPAPLRASAVDAVAISPDGARIAALQSDGAVMQWRRGQETARIALIPFKLFSLAFSPDGAFLAVTGAKFKLEMKLGAGGKPGEVTVTDLESVLWVENVAAEASFDLRDTTTIFKAVQWTEPGRLLVLGSRVREGRLESAVCSARVRQRDVELHGAAVVGPGALFTLDAFAPSIGAVVGLADGQLVAWKILDVEEARAPTGSSSAVTREDAGGPRRSQAEGGSERVVVGTCESCGKPLRVKARGVRSKMRLTCKCGHVSDVSPALPTPDAGRRERGADPSVRPGEAARELVCALIVFSKDFEPKSTFVDSILERMTAHGRPYRAWIRASGAPVGWCVHSHAREPVAFLAAATVNFRKQFGVEPDHEAIEYATFEGSHGIHGAIVTQWRAVRAPASPTDAAGSIGGDVVDGEIVVDAPTTLPESTPLLLKVTGLRPPHATDENARVASLVRGVLAAKSLVRTTVRNGRICTREPTDHEDGTSLEMVIQRAWDRAEDPDKHVRQVLL